jgi:nitroreductase
VTETRDFFATAHSMRAHREFSDRPVGDETIARILEAATFAPSAENTQPWVFVVVRDPVARAAIGEVTRQAWEHGGREYSKTRLSPKLFSEVDRGATGGVSGAPVLVVVGVDTSRCAGPALSASIFPAIQNLLLAANALGLGSALTTLPTVLGNRLHELVGFPDHVDAVAVVPLGWPARELGRPRRAPVTEKAHRERYGTPW